MPDEHGVELIRQGWIDLNIKTRESETVLHVLARRATSKLLEALPSAFLSPAKLTAQNDEGFTPMHVAIECRQPQNVFFFLVHGVGVDQKTKNGLRADELARRIHESDMKSRLKHKSGIRYQRDSIHSSNGWGVLATLKDEEVYHGLLQLLKERGETNPDIELIFKAKEVSESSTLRRVVPEDVAARYFSLKAPQDCDSKPDSPSPLRSGVKVEPIVERLENSGLT